MNRFTPVLIFLFMATACAWETAGAEGPQGPQGTDASDMRISVWTSGHVPTARAILPRSYSIIDRDKESKQLRQAGYLEPSQREALFRKTGVDSRLKGFDDFDKDILVMAVPYYSVTELKSQYPMLSEAQIRSLKRELGRRR